MSSKTRARKKPEPINAAASLLSALKFISLAQKKEGLQHQTCCSIANGFVYAFDGTLAAGCKIDEDLTACPQTMSLIAALSRCRAELVITNDINRLSIKSGPFRAFVPCIDPAQIPTVPVDPPTYPVDGAKLLKALETVSVLADDNANEVWASSVLLSTGTASASDGRMLLQYWHANDMPTVSIPTEAVSALLKTKKTPVKFGYGGKSLTFHFEDESWLRTNLYEEEWPDITSLIDVQSNAWPIGERFFEAVEAVAPFNKDGVVYFIENAVCSENNANAGATFECHGVPAGKIYASKYLLMIKNLATRIDFKQENRCLFFGENLRGLIMERVI